LKVNSSFEPFYPKTKFFSLPYSFEKLNEPGPTRLFRKLFLKVFQLTFSQDEGMK
jgi:hypothetical protein